jgi:hypothetical protein
MAPDLSRMDALIDAVERHLSMDDLMRTLAAIRDLDRWFTFPKFLESARRTADELRSVGCDDAEVVEFPADGRTVFGDFVMPLAWDVGQATLEIVEPAAEARVLQRRPDEPNATVMWCGPTPPEGLAGGIVLWDEFSVEQRASADLGGKFLYTRAKPASAKAAALKAGALGVIGSYGFRREGDDFRDCVCWNNAWSETTGWAMTAADRPLPGFNISPAQGDEIEQLAKAEPGLKLRMTADCRLYEGTVPIVSGLLRGATDREIVLIGHQFEIGAVDNASGCATIVEAARCVKRMLAAGDLPSLIRSARFMTSSEMYSSIPFATERPDVVGRMIAGLDLDMVCPYGGYESSPMDFYQSPDANAYFGDDLLELIVRRVWERNGSPWAWERMPTQLSDNCWCDPYVGVPMSWISWHGREFWHSSGDTVGRVPVDAIRDVATATITWLAFLLTASPGDVSWLAGAELGLATERVAAEKAEERRSYLRERELRRIDSLAELGQSAAVNEARRTVSALSDPLHPVPCEAADEAARLVPVRRCAAPLTFAPIPPGERDFASPLWSSMLNSALYWCDGRRTIREVERLATLEHGKAPPVDLLAWFRFLERHGYIELEAKGK